MSHSGRRASARLRCTVAALAAAVVTAALPAGATASGNAAFTTVNPLGGACVHGTAVNCNAYSSKDDVFINGGPTGGSGLADGTYFFAVLDPGAQNTFLGGTGLLSTDAVSERTFTVAGHQIASYGGTTHATGTDLDGHEIIGVAPFDDTSNAGGVYILAICAAGATSPSDCKFDAFKVGTGTAATPQPLTVTKDAQPAFARGYAWAIAKDVDRTRVEQIGGTATFNYTVTVTRSGPTDGGWQVTGTITVFNPNDADVTGVDVTDAINDPSATCAVTTGTNQTIPADSPAGFAYTCTYSAAPAHDAETNTATATWPAQDLGTGHLDAGSAPFDVGFTFGTGTAGNPTVSDDCVSVSDSYAGSLGTVCSGDASPKKLTYSRTVPVPQFNCQSYGNTATYTTNTTGTTGSASQTVQVCGPARTGALTMGFWQNKNGQGIIAGGASLNGTCRSGTWLQAFAPFQDLSATATCAQVATYVYNAVKAAVCTSTSKTCNAMLKAQMLATALDVYFSDATLGGNRIGAYNGLGAAQPAIGSVSIDLTRVCGMIDGTGGTATCSGTFEDVRSAFGGATALTVGQMLSYAASQSNPGGSVWYAQVKATQVLAKDAFDAVNNQVAFGA